MTSRWSHNGTRIRKGILKANQYLIFIPLQKQKIEEALIKFKMLNLIQKECGIIRSA